MNGNVIKLLMIAAIGAFVYEKYYNVPTVDPKQIPNTGMPNNPINNIAVMTPQAIDPIKTKLAIEAGVIDGLNWYQWNYYLKHITGQDVNLAAGIDPASIVSLDTFWNAINPIATATGLHGTSIYTNAYESNLTTMRYM